LDIELGSIKNNNDELEINYQLFIKKSDRNLVLAKCYIIKISAIDDLLDNIHENIILLLENELIDLHDYTVTFKLQNAAGAETQLIDNQDFVKFYIDYKKFKFFNKDMRIL